MKLIKIKALNGFTKKYSNLYMIKKLRSDINRCIRRRIKYCHKASPLAMMYYIIIIHPFQSVVKKH